MTAPEIKALIEQLAPVCKHHGIARLSVDGGRLEMEFVASSTVDHERVKEFQRMMEAGVPTDDEVMNWSAPGFVPEDREKHIPAPLARNRKGRE